MRNVQKYVLTEQINKCVMPINTNTLGDIFHHIYEQLHADFHQYYNSCFLTTLPLTPHRPDLRCYSNPIAHSFSSISQQSLAGVRTPYALSLVYLYPKNILRWKHVPNYCY